jgi:hypothetical protein
VSSNRTAPTAEYDVFVCCPDPARVEAGATLVAFLTRAGFRVFFEPEPGRTPAAARLALARSASDFILLPPPDPGTPDSGEWHTEVSAALGSGRNIVRVSFAGEPAQASATSVPGLDGLAAQQAAAYDPDRLAESLSVIQHCLSTDSIVNDRHMMRRTKRWFLFAGLLVLAGFSAQTAPILYREWMRPKPLPPVAPFALHWSAFAERDAAGTVETCGAGSGCCSRERR